jgi:hypothetical protein
MTEESCFRGDTGEQHTVDNPLRSPSPRSLYSRIPEGISEEAWRSARNPPLMELFSHDPFENITDVAAPTGNIVAACKTCFITLQQNRHVETSSS